MAKATLATNFKDDILNSSMGNKRRYNLIQNSDGTVSLEDVSTYDQVGSEYGSSQVNATNKAINASADAGKIIDDVDDISAVTEEGYIAGALALKAVNSSLTADNGQGFQFAYDSESGKYGYMAEVDGADTFCPFKSSGDYENIPFSLAGTNNKKGADNAKVTATKDINNGLLFVLTCTHISDTKQTLSYTSDGSPVLELLYDEGINPRAIVYKVSNLKKGEYIKVNHLYINASTFTLCEFPEGMNFSVSDSFQTVDSHSFFYATSSDDVATGIVFAVCASSIQTGTGYYGYDNIYTTCGKTTLISLLQSEISDYKWCCDSVISTISDYKANNRIACYRPYADNGGSDPIIIVVKCI